MQSKFYLPVESPGTDHAGIATQLQVEKLLIAEGTTREEVGREAFLERVWDYKAEQGGHITRQLRSLGASADWSRERFTMDDSLSEAVSEAFVRLHEKGLVYRGEYLVNWAPLLKTAVSDLEVEYSEEEGKLYYFKYMVEGGDEYLPVATTRPETIMGDTAVCVHPEDKRYKNLIGKQAVVPMSGGRTIPIIADEYVDMEFGTGALKITPGHDPNDYALGKKFDLPLINIMNKDGSMNANAGEYDGLDRFDCREKLWADMEAQGLTIKAEPHMQRVPRSQRGGEIIEPLVSSQWFVKTEGMGAKALKAVQDGDIKIVPQRFDKIWNNWLTDIRDWCVSRQLWWGHRIPVWYVGESGESEYIVARNEAEARRKAVEAGHPEDVVLRQEEDVLDTWFSSGLWPFATLGWPGNEGVENSDLDRFYPGSCLETGYDILFFWVARMVMMGIELTGKSPFDVVYLHGLVRAADGTKMSKTKGNVLDPLDTVAEFGADSLRYSLVTGVTPGQVSFGACVPR
jgi:valyl-tRNA synthetase